MSLSPLGEIFTNLVRVEKPSRYSIGMHFRSHDLMVTLNVAVVKCEAHNRTGRSENGKISTRKASSDIRGSKYTRRREIGGLNV